MRKCAQGYIFDKQEICARGYLMAATNAMGVQLTTYIRMNGFSVWTAWTDLLSSSPRTTPDLGAGAEQTEV